MQKNSPHRQVDDARRTSPHVVSFRPRISGNANRTHTDTTSADGQHPLDKVIDTIPPYYDDPLKCTCDITKNTLELVKIWLQNL